LTREPDAAALIGAVKAGATQAFLAPPVIARLLYAGEAAAEISGTIAIPVGRTCCCEAGKAAPGNEIRIVGPETGDQLPNGEAGEIWVHSNQRLTCYLNRPQATADTITADGWLRTGDIGHLDADGYVYIEDRLKDMIITGGENVYGPEVESVLMQHPAVADAAVIGVPDDFWGESVKAIVVTATEIEPAGIIEFCRRQLAGYKCPRTVDFAPSLPRNASGKIVKVELRQPYWQDRGRRV
jgi:acyl-CoA synthetase (AMP-forming)/AMP-acid ligase II